MTPDTLTTSERYDWRKDPPGKGTAQRIRRRVLQAMDRFPRGDAETIEAALDLQEWVDRLQLDGIPESDVRMIRSLLGEIADAYVLVPPDRQKGTAAARVLLGFMTPG